MGDFCIIYNESNRVLVVPQEISPSLAAVAPWMAIAGINVTYKFDFAYYGSLMSLIRVDQYLPFTEAQLYLGCSWEL